MAYIRKKTVKGVDYFQIVEGVRTGDKVTQNVIASLGTDRDPKKALKRLTSELRAVVALRVKFGPKDRNLPKMLAAQIKAWDNQIDKLTIRVEALARFIASGELKK